MPMWTLDTGLRVVRALQQPIRQFGYHLAIGGGVVNKGESQKDLDLYFLPMSHNGNSDQLLIFLKEIWGSCEDIGKDYENEYEHPCKLKVKFFRRERTQRIDCFIY